MKNVLLFLSLILFSCSCKTIQMGAVPSSDTQAFVKLKNGKVIEAREVKTTNRKIIADDNIYAKKEVKMYSDGTGTYGNVSKSTFARKVFDGDVNVYRTITEVTTVSSSGAMHTSHRYTDYIQQKNSDEIKLLTYKSLKHILPPGDPAMPYLNTYKKNQHKGTLTLIGGLGMFFAGAAVVANNFSTNSAANNTKGSITGQRYGGLMIGVGMGATLTAPIIWGRNSLNLRRAVAKHNKVL